MTTWRYGLTADEWLTLASVGQDSEVGPCCAAIADLRSALQVLTTTQDGPTFIAAEVTDAYTAAVGGHDTLAEPATFPLLHRVLAGIAAEQRAQAPLPSA